jgi:hypothetical protein
MSWRIRPGPTESGSEARGPGSVALRVALPITIRFARRVCNVMREVPPERDPMPQFKFYT